MVKTTYFIHSLIAYDILSIMSSDSTTYNITSHKGLTALKNLAIQLASHEVKSCRGAYEQGKLIGFCIATGWAKKNQPVLAQTANSEECKEFPSLKGINEGIITDLVKLNSIILVDQSAPFLSIKAKKAQQAFFLNTTLPKCIIKGFQHGMRLGNQIARQLRQNKKDNSTDNLISSLLALVSQPHSTKRITRQPILQEKKALLEKKYTHTNE